MQAVSGAVQQTVFGAVAVVEFSKQVAGLQEGGVGAVQLQEMFAVQSDSAKFVQFLLLEQPVSKTAPKQEAKARSFNEKT